MVVVTGAARTNKPASSTCKTISTTIASNLISYLLATLQAGVFTRDACLHSRAGRALPTEGLPLGLHAVYIRQPCLHLNLFPILIYVILKSARFWMGAASFAGEPSIAAGSSPAASAAFRKRLLSIRIHSRPRPETGR